MVKRESDVAKAEITGFKAKRMNPHPLPCPHSLNDVV